MAFATPTARITLVKHHQWTCLLLLFAVHSFCYRSYSIQDQQKKSQAGQGEDWSFPNADETVQRRQYSSSGWFREESRRGVMGESEASYRRGGSKSSRVLGPGAKYPDSATSSSYGGCPSPREPAFSSHRCNKYSGCRFTCFKNYEFREGETEISLVCKNKKWVASGNWDTIPDCKPICLPACQNTGICVGPNQCNCPEKFRGPQCQFENKPCVNMPPNPANSFTKCGPLSCTIQCQPNHQFPDGSTITNMVCKDGNWIPSRPEWKSVPDCEVICKPPCLNGGICLSYNMCQCPKEFRGPQCQHDADRCSAMKLGFNGSYNCTSSGTSFSCSLSCPGSVEFEFPAASVYTCDYATGLFSPSPIPQCKYGPGYRIISPLRPLMTGVNGSKLLTTDLPFVKNKGLKIGLIPTGIVPDIAVIEDRTPKSASCFTWGHSHYKTFDGKVFDFTSSCLYTFVRDSADNTFSISLSSNKGCNYGSECYRNITIFIEDREYILALDEKGDAIMALNGFQRIAIPSKTREFTVEMVAHFVILTLHSCGVTIHWNSKDYVQVDVSERLWNKTAGLCGNLDGYAANDIMKKDGTTPKSLLEFVNSWVVDELESTCMDSPSDLDACIRDTIEDPSLVSQAENFCHKLLIDPKFETCRKIIDVKPFYEACRWDYCECEKLNSIECACHAISVFVQECSRNGVKEMANWRDDMTCPVTCHNGKVYSTCGPTVQETCGSVMETVTTSLKKPVICVEGCFCPDGMLLENGKCITRAECPCQLRGKKFSPGETFPCDCNTCRCEDGQWACTQAKCGARCASIGDPHYTTFDGRHFNFMGKCSYYLMKGDNYSIEAENIACAGAISEAMNFPMSAAAGLPSCTKTIIINYDGQTIKLKQNKEISLNGEELTQVPYIHHGILIRMVSSLFVMVELPIGLDIWWDGMTRAYIDASAELQGKTKGLCGTFNQNQKDDFLTPEGDIEQSVIPFANKWKTSEKCEDLPDKFLEKPCDVNIQKKALAESHCQKIKGKTFEICNWLVDPEPFYQDCLYDMCSCEAKIGSCLCPILSAYAKECANRGLKLDWRMDIRECGIHCPGNQKYQVCGNSCTRSCFDISSRAGEAKCKRKCVEGCNCEEGQTLDSRGQCVPISNCPCLHQGLEFLPGHKLLIPGNRETEVCTCKNALWDCKHATEKDIKETPSIESLRMSCSSAKNEEFTNCEPEEPVTCKNMHNPPYSTAKCKTGCKCKKGYVLDTYSKTCIKPADCPCHHGGKSYAESQKIQEDCNTCVCSSGRWKCTESVCSGVCTGWGESHFKTFDGRIYDFHGSCDYMFAKGKISANEVFEVIIQNVPCGSSGIACSKSVTLKVGAKQKPEIVTFSKDEPLPVFMGLKRIAVRQAGLFVFAEVADLGIVLQWDKGTRIYLKANPLWKNKIRGLCGNYNDNELDDFLTPSGGISEVSPVVFGDSWKVQEYCPESYEVKDTCTTHPNRKVWAMRKCGILKSEIFQPCHSEVSLEPYLERCIFDTCGCDMGGDCECLCTSIAAYAQECNIRGVPIRWRSQELCPIQCDESCAHYSPCIQTCPKQTCDNQLIYKSLIQLCKEDSCVEGCELKPCPDGEVYESLDNLKCVPLSSCQTICMTIGNETYFEGDKIEGDECHSCFCSRHEKVCQGKPCTTTSSPATKTPSPVTTTSSPATLPNMPNCISGWSPWISNDKPSEKKPTDIERISAFHYSMVRNNEPICLPEFMKKIECRTVEKHIPHKKTGQNVLCSTAVGVVCEPMKIKGITEVCHDYEYRVLCECATTRKLSITPTSSTTKSSSITSTVSSSTSRSSTTSPVTTPTTGITASPTLGPSTTTAPVPEICVPGWSPWINNDRPIDFISKYDDSEGIPTFNLHEYSGDEGICDSSMMKDIECRAVETKDHYNSTGQDVTCNLDEGLICKPSLSESSEQESCLDYEVRVFCECGTTTKLSITPTSSTTKISSISSTVSSSTSRSSTTSPVTTPTTGITASPTLGPSTTTAPVPEICVPGWSPWINNDRPIDFISKYDDSEGIPTFNLHEYSGDEGICDSSMMKDIECRAVETKDHYNSTGQDVTCNLDEGLICKPSLSESSEQESCLDYEVRVFCECGTTTKLSITPTSSTTKISSISSTVSSSTSRSSTTSPVTTPTTGITASPTLGPSTTTAPVPEICVPGWSPWINNDRPIDFISKYDDSEGIPTFNLHEYSGDEGICDSSMMKDIECRAVETKDHYNSTGQDVTCNLDEGLICKPSLSESSEQESCLDYEVRVFCECGTTTKLSITPTSSTTKISSISSTVSSSTSRSSTTSPVTTPTTGITASPTLGPSTTTPPVEEICVPGWSPWINNDRPIDFISKYDDSEGIPTFNLHEYSGDEGICDSSMMKDIECRAVETKDHYNSTGQDVTCNLDEGLICKPSLSESSEQESCLDYEVRVFCECGTTTKLSITPTSSTTKISSISSTVSSSTSRSSTTSPVTTPTTGITASPTLGPSTTTPPVEEICVPGWSPWINNDRPIDFISKYDDSEGIPTFNLHEYSGDEGICDSSMMKDIECRAVETKDHYNSTGQDVTCNLDEGLICKPSLSESSEQESCLDYEVRVFCECGTTTKLSITPTSSTTKISSISSTVSSSTSRSSTTSPVTTPTTGITASPTLGPSTTTPPVEEICVPGWSPWINNDRPIDFISKYDDKELIPNLDMQEYSSDEARCILSMMKDIECRRTGTNDHYNSTGQDVTCNLREGLICRPSLSELDEIESCFDYEIRVLCDCESKEACQDGLGMESGYIKDDQISVSSVNTPGHLGNHARLNGKGAWVARKIHVPNEWIQVDLLEKKEISGVVIQGNSARNEWVKKFEVGWSDDGDSWTTIKEEESSFPKVFEGNSDAHSPKRVLFENPVYSRYIRVIPVEFHQWIALRLEILGCDIKVSTTSATTTTTRKIITPMPCDPAHPNYPHETDCHKFFQCADRLGHVEMVEKTCGAHMMFHPEKLICDWPAAVIQIRPECAVTSSVISSTRTTAIPHICPPRKVWKKCAFKCNQLCHHFDGVLKSEGLCASSTDCIPGCVHEYADSCPDGWLWRDQNTCLQIEDCTCISHSGLIVKPGKVYEESGCEKCQCERNLYTCDRSACSTTSTQVSSSAPMIFTETKGTSTIGPPVSKLNCEWTEWFDKTDPKHTDGDFESIHDVQQQKKCGNVSLIECVTVDDETPFNETGNSVTCDLEHGLRCYNKDNGKIGCRNYKIKICCRTDIPLTTAETVSTTVTTTTGELSTLILPPPKECTPCPNLPLEKMRNCDYCPEGLLWDGSKCIRKSDCKCYVGHIGYPVGTTYRTENCTECICKMGGLSSCHEIICPKCKKGEGVEMTPKCGCICKPCPPNSRICPTTGVCIPESLWCNGVKDCPDDEVDCPTLSPPYVPSTPCPKPNCPPGYEIFMSKEVPRSKGRSKGKVKGGRRDKLVSWCPPYECVTTLVPSTTTPCPEPQCPEGFEMKKIKMDDSFRESTCPEFHCQPIQPPEEECHMNGKSFETFDGLDYTYNVCHHVLAKDIVNNRWSIEVHKNCSTCPTFMIIKQDFHTLKFNEDITVEYGLYSYTAHQAQKIGSKHMDFFISKVGDSLYFKANHYGFWVRWDGKTSAKVVVTSKLLNGTSGLCGFYSNDVVDDTQKPDGSLAITTKDFGDSWLIEGFDECEIQECPQEIQNKALEICSLSRSKPFIKCKEMINIDKVVSQCMETTCTCLENHRKDAVKKGLVLEPDWTDDCRCDALLNFATQCKEIDSSFDLSDWRIIHNCPITCPPGEIYKDCYTRECEPSCDSLLLDDPCPTVNDTCFPGCFCPDGLVRKGKICVPPKECRDCTCDCFGDPNYFTFDRTNFKFHGNCTYIASRDIKPERDHEFQVLVTNKNCGVDKPTGTCTYAVTVLYKSHHVYLQRVESAKEVKVILDGEHLINFPFNNGWLQVENLGGKEVTVLIPPIQLEVSYFFDDYAFRIRLPSQMYGDGTEGLCSNCNKNKVDDLKKRDGQLTDDVNDFGMSWLENLPPVLGLPIEEECDIVPENKTECIIPPKTEDPCITSLMDEDKFKKCLPLVTPEPYIVSCQEEICHSNDKNKTICQYLESYARECEHQGICLDWRTDDLCPYECPSGMEYHPCGSGCLETCDNHGDKTTICSMSSTDGCYCPSGKVWKDNKCVEVKLCKACDEEGHYPGDIWHPDKCQECRCTESQKYCNVTVCPEVVTICERPFMPVKVSDSEDKCCPKYTCELATPPPCESEPQKPKCAFGQELQIRTSISGCREFICVCVPLDKCEELTPPSPIEVESDDIDLESEHIPGLETYKDYSGCCPVESKRCNLTLCPPHPECSEHYRVVELPVPKSKCCPEHKCVPPDNVCLYEHEYSASGKSLNEGEMYTSIRKVGEKWSDGPCKECICKSLGELGRKTKTKGGIIKGGRKTSEKVFKPSCTTISCPSVEDHSDLDDYVLKEVPVPGKCCPVMERTACKVEGKVYQVGKVWSEPGNPCISHQCVLSTNASLVIKQFKVTECERDCDVGWEYKESEDPSNKCCGQCKQTACLHDGKLHSVGTSWLSSDHCTTYYCREVEGIIQTQSVDVVCPKDDRLFEEFKVEVLPIKGQCCNKTIPFACLIGEHELKEGETFMVTKCKKISCVADPETTLAKKETVETCNKNCKKGWEYMEPSEDSEKCCGECKQIACISEDGKVIPPGSQWTTNDGCTTHVCQEKEEQLNVIISEEKCPSIDGCPPENIYQEKCCKRCNTTETCPPQAECAAVDVDPVLTVGVINENKDYHVNCVNPDPIPALKECKGSCQSMSFFDKSTLSHQNDCKCCQPTTVKSIKVEVVCQDGFTYHKKVTTPTECMCDACQSSKSGNIKTPTKMGMKPFSLMDASEK